MSRRSSVQTRRSSRRYSKRYSRQGGNRSQPRPSMFWGRLLLTTIVLLIIWAHWKGQA